MPMPTPIAVSVAVWPTASAEHITPRGAECHPDADFVGALRHHDSAITP